MLEINKNLLNVTIRACLKDNVTSVKTKLFLIVLAQKKKFETCFFFKCTYLKGCLMLIHMFMQ